MNKARRLFYIELLHTKILIFSIRLLQLACQFYLLLFFKYL